MQVFILGGTGTIGTAVVAELVSRNHQVLALSRSEKSDELLMSAGATAFRGNLKEPDHWADAAVSSDAIIQAAATFGEDMADVDARAMKALMQASETRTEPTRLIYTGGCWLYGETGDEIATEDRPFDPLPSFSWMVTHAKCCSTRLSCAQRLSILRWSMTCVMVECSIASCPLQRLVKELKSGGVRRHAGRYSKALIWLVSIATSSNALSLWATLTRLLRKVSP